MQYFIMIIKILILSSAVAALLVFTGNKISIPHFVVRIALMIVLCFEVLSLFKRIFYDSSVKVYYKNICLLFASIFILFIFLELVFMFVPRSHYNAASHGSKIWHTYYWNPVNTYGFRDKEPQQSDSTLLFVGDSFTAGWGIKNVSNRFSDIVDNKLDGFHSINIGVPGVDTHREYTIMNEFINNSGIRPSKIILQHFGDDIREAAFRNNKYDYRHKYGYNIPKVLRHIIQRSCLLDYLYWSYPRGDNKSFFDFFYQAYTDSLIFSEHLKDLQKFIDYSNDNSIELIVVLFPFMQALDISKDLYINNLIAFFDNHNIITIDVTTLVKDLELKERVVNRYDAHASKLVNQKVADEIIKIIKNK